MYTTVLVIEIVVIEIIVQKIDVRSLWYQIELIEDNKDLTF